MLTNKQFDEFKQELNTIIDIYKKEFSNHKPTDYKTYEKQWVNRLRTALKEIKTVIDQAEKRVKIKPSISAGLQKRRQNKKSSYYLPRTLLSSAAERWQSPSVVFTL
jgi:sugar-specific transcriptional regulator TrmB